jgi:hypothetical protein
MSADAQAHHTVRDSSGLRIGYVNRCSAGRFGGRHHYQAFVCGGGVLTERDVCVFDAVGRFTDARDAVTRSAKAEGQP